MVEEISRLPNIKWLAWLLLVNIMQIYNEKEEVWLKELHSVQFGEEKDRSLMWQSRCILGETFQWLRILARVMKKRPPDLYLDNGKTHPARLPTHKRTKAQKVFYS